MRRLAADEDQGPPAMPVDVPKNGELRLPTGGDRFTKLKMFRAEAVNVML